MTKLAITLIFLLCLYNPCQGQWKLGRQDFNYPLDHEKIMDIYLAYDNNIYATTKTEYFVKLYVSADLGYSWSEIKRFEEVESLYFIHEFSREYRKTSPVWISNGDSISTDLCKTWKPCRLWDLPEGHLPENCWTSCHRRYYLPCNENLIWEYDKYLYGGFYDFESGKHYSIAKSENMGSSWSYFIENFRMDWKSLFFLNDKRGYFIGSNGFFYEYNGSEWIKRTVFTIVGKDSRIVNAKNTSWWSIDFIDKNTGWVSGLQEGKNLLLRTRDGGDTWENISSDAHSLNYMHFLTADHGFAISGCQLGIVIVETTDGGETWSAFGGSYLPEVPWYMGNGFAIFFNSYRDSENFLENTGFRTLVNESIISSIREKQKSVQPPIIHPNPVSSQTIISLPDQKNIHQLEIYDLTGQLIYRKDALNTPEYRLEKGNLQAGIYLLKVRGERFYAGKVIIE